MNSIPGMMKDTAVNKRLYKRDILVYWSAKYSVSEISRKLNINHAYIQKTLIEWKPELEVYFKEAI